MIESTAPRSAPVVVRYATYLVLMPLVGGATAFFGCMSLVCGWWDHSGRQQHAIARVWAATLLRISMSPATLVGAHHLEAGAVAVYASNHLSYMDTPVLFARLPFQFRILAKQSLWKTPFVGWYLQRSGQVPVDANSGRSMIAGLLRGVATLKSGMPLVLFPEGGRTTDGGLQTMLPGCAFMAIKAQVPLVPIALVGTYELLPMHTYYLRPRPLKVVIGEPIATTGLTTRDADRLTKKLYDSISVLFANNS